jgi:hypothetical protein
VPYPQRPVIDLFPARLTVPGQESGQLDALLLHARDPTTGLVRPRQGS